MDFDELNKLAFQSVVLNNYESWVALTAIIKEGKKKIKIKPYDFTNVDLSDFAVSLKKYIEVLKTINKQKCNLIEERNYSQTANLRAKEVEIINELTKRINYKFSDGKYFKIKDGVILHLFEIPLLKTKITQIDFYNLFNRNKFL